MRVAALLLVFVLSGCDTAINMGINLGSQLVLDGVGLAIRSSDQPDQVGGQHCDNEKGCVNDGTP